MRSNTATREFFVGLPGLGQTLLKAVIECSLGDKPPEHAKRQNWFAFHFMPVVPVGFPVSA